MSLRVLVAGGLKDPGNWDPFARSLGEDLAKQGLALGTLSDSPFGRQVAEGYAKGQGASIRVHGENPPSALLAHAIAGERDPLAEAAREADVVLLAGHGRDLRPLASLALARHVPLVAIPIPRTTSEEIWEENLAHFPRIDVDMPTRTAVLGLRKLDARSRAGAAALAGTLAKLAAARDLAVGPRALLVAPPPSPAPGEDTLDEVLRRALRAVVPGASFERAGPGWLRSPGRGFIDAALHADVLIADLGVGEAALYAAGVARGAQHPAIVLLRRGSPVGLDPGALDATTYEGDRELARLLEARLSRAVGRREAPRTRGPAKKGGRKRGRKGRGRGGAAGGAPEHAPPEGGPSKGGAAGGAGDASGA